MVDKELSAKVAKNSWYNKIQQKHSIMMTFNTAHVIPEVLFVPEVNVIETLQNCLQLIGRVEGFQSVGAYHVLNLLLQCHL